MTMEEKKQPAKKIAICTPIGRFADPDYMVSIFKTMNYFKGRAEIAWYQEIGHANLPNARNILAGRALQWGADDVIFIDDDIGWEPEEFLKLLYVPDGAQIVAGAPQRRMPDVLEFCGGPDNKLQWDCGEGRALYSGFAATAFLRVTRAAFEALADKVEEYTYEREPYRAFFNYKIGLTPSGREKGFIAEDYYFSMLAKENGIEVWIDPTIRLRHWHRQPLTAVLCDHVRVREKNDDPVAEATGDSHGAR